MEAYSHAAVQKEESGSNHQTEDRQDETQNEEEQICQLPKIPVKGTVKWEKGSSDRISKNQIAGATT